MNNQVFVGNKFALSLRLIVMNFLQYAIWGAYLISMGSFLAQMGLGKDIWLYYAVQGIVSIFMPALMGIVADKWIPAQKTLSLCHGISALAMFILGFYAMTHSSFDVSYTSSSSFNATLFFVIYTISVAFYMPTIALSNSVAYNGLELYGMDTVKSFPPIRVFGTVGFIFTELLVNFVKDPNAVQVQHSYWQFYVAATFGLLLAIYSLTLPKSTIKPNNSKSFADIIGLKAFSLFKEKNFAVFFIFSMLLGASLQITNAYGNTFISSFKEIAEFKDSWGSQNANALISISQISETLCILLIPFFMKRFGIKNVMVIAMFAWVLRFGFFAIGDTGSGLWLLILSCVIYGVAFDFFNISGSLYVNNNTDKSIRSSAQGLFMLMTNGLGATIGTWAAGMVVNKYVFIDSPDWHTAWCIFAIYAFVVAVAFILLFRNPNKNISR